MSPLKKKKLNIVRKKLDKIDNSLINIIRQRTLLVKKVLELKDYKNEIIDRERIRKILKNIRVKSLQKKIDPRITKRIWHNMIYAYIDFEKRNFKKK